MEAGYLEMRKLAYIDAGSKANADPMGTIEGFARCDMEGIEAEVCRGRARELLPQEHPDSPPEPGTPRRLYWDGYAFLRSISESDVVDPPRLDSDPFSRRFKTLFDELKELSGFVNTKSQAKG